MSTLEAKDALTEPARFIACAAIAVLVVSVTRFSLIPTMPSDEPGWAMENLAEVKERELVVAKCRLRDLQSSCLDKKRKVAERVSEALFLAVVVTDDAVIAALLYVGLNFNLNIGLLLGQSTSNWAVVVSLATKLSGPED